MIPGDRFGCRQVPPCAFILCLQPASSIFPINPTSQRVIEQYSASLELGSEWRHGAGLRLKRGQPAHIAVGGLLIWQRPTLAGPVVRLPLALRRFTSVFGMGTGGSTALWSPEAGQGWAFDGLCCAGHGGRYSGERGNDDYQGTTAVELLKKGIS